MAGSLDQRTKQRTKDLEWDYDSSPNQVTSDSSLGSEQQPVTYDRRELRRRLSLDSDHEDELGSQISARIRRSILRERLNQRPNLQICFVQDDLTTSSEIGTDDDQDEDQDVVAGYSSVSSHETSPAADKSHPPVKHSVPTPGLLTQWFGSFGSKENDSPSDLMRRNFGSFDEYHRHIHTEAKKALKSAKEMAKMQMQLEKQQPHTKAGQVVDEQVMHCSQQELQSMTRMQLRLLITRIVNRTEELNVSLVKRLEERDELLMEQDSLLVDIQDLTHFLNTSHW